MVNGYPPDLVTQWFHQFDRDLHRNPSMLTVKSRFNAEKMFDEKGFQMFERPWAERRFLLSTVDHTGHLGPNGEPIQRSIVDHCVYQLVNVDLCEDQVSNVDQSVDQLSNMGQCVDHLSNVDQFMDQPVNHLSFMDNVDQVIEMNNRDQSVEIQRDQWPVMIISFCPNLSSVAEVGFKLRILYVVHISWELFWHVHAAPTVALINQSHGMPSTVVIAIAVHNMWAIQWEIWKLEWVRASCAPIDCRKTSDNSMLNAGDQKRDTIHKTGGHSFPSDSRAVGTGSQSVQ